MKAFLRGVRRAAAGAVIWNLLAAATARGDAAPGPDAAAWESSVQQAETAGRWDEAGMLYREELGRNPGRAELWVKLADLENARGNTNAVIPALEAAVKAKPADAALHARLSKLYATANKPVPAFREIDEAARLDPQQPEYWKARANLANWLGRYRDAGDSYERLIALTLQGAAYGLMLAKARTWQGDLDGGARAYRSYLKTNPENADALLEYARVESWRGDYGAALGALDQYEKQFPSTPKPDADRARTLAWADRPRAAESLNEPLLAKKPGDYELQTTRTVALAKGNRTAEALESLDKLVALRPDSEEVVELKRFIEAPLKSDATLYGRYYRDEDNLRIWQESLAGTWSVNPETRIGAHVEFWQLSADLGSGLENVDGSESADYTKAALDLRRILRPSLELSASAGYASVDEADGYVVYDLTLGARPGDEFRAAVRQQHDYLLVSPRTASLGIRRDTSIVSADWTPGMNVIVAGVGQYDRYTDGNERWGALLGPRVVTLRTDVWDLDVGVRAQLFGFSQDLDSGYYDPELYQQYALTLFNYLKMTPDSGLSLIAAAGYFRDDSMTQFDFGWSADAELMLGLRRGWTGRLSGHVVQNLRESGGAFNAVAASATLVRRF